MKNNFLFLEDLVINLNFLTGIGCVGESDELKIVFHMSSGNNICYPVEDFEDYNKKLKKIQDKIYIKRF